MGCPCSKEKDANKLNEYTSNVQENIYLDDINIEEPIGDYVQVEEVDPDAFNSSLIQQRQQAIDNRAYRTTIDLWQPESLEQLAETIKSFSKGKSLVDRHWIIFYWIACHIDYDTVAYFSKNYQNQSVEGVFRTRKGVCAGYAKLYKYLSEQMQMRCEIVRGYSKDYQLDNGEEVPSEANHAWNAVEIDNHWYLIESTWGAGHLTKEKTYQRKLNTYYFLPRPNQMIYDHLPEEDEWQLLQTPINKTQFMQMPKVYPSYFDMDFELVSPRNQAHVDFLPDKPYAVVLIRARSNVHLIADLRLNDQKIKGGHRIVFNDRKQLYRCYFAPSMIGQHKITIYGKQHGEVYDSALELNFNVTRLPSNRMSFPETWKNFFSLGLEVVSPRNTHAIRLRNGVNHAEIRIRASKHVELMGRLKNEQNEEVEGADHVYYDQKNDIWRCQFALNQTGRFDAFILAKKKSDSGEYTSAISFEIEASRISSNPVSYPHTWQVFHDLGLTIEAPKNRANVVWPKNASYAEVLIQAPDDVILSCGIRYEDVLVKNGSLAQFDQDKNLWQLLFAPEQTGLHELIVYAKREDDTKSSLEAVVKFNLDVTKLRRPMKFPLTYSQFQTKKCRIYTPLDGRLKKESVIPIHCFIPGARDVNIKVDSEWLTSEGYANSILRRRITAGSGEVTICARYGEESKYDGLVKYSVQ